MRILRRLVPTLRTYPILVDGFAPIYIDLGRPSWQEHELFLSPRTHEPHILAIFKALISPTDVVLDIGANLGRHTVALDPLAGQVHAFEPNPTLLPNLRRTVAGLRHTTLHECALGDRTGFVELYVPQDHSMARVVDSGGSIPVHRLDDMLPGPIALMKVDVEGAEALVFRGAERLINRTDAPVIIFEELRHRQDAKGCLDSYVNAAYEFWVIQADGQIEPYTENRPEWCDILAVPAARRTTVAERLTFPI